MFNHWMFRCQDISRLISRSMDEKLPLRTRMGIKFHLMMCDLCLRYKKQLDLIQKAILKVDSQKNTDAFITPLPGPVKEKIKKRLEPKL